RWRVRLEKVNKNVAWGRGVELLLPSPERVESSCSLYGRCGGCQFCHMTYAEELRAKSRRIADALERVGHVKLDLPPVLGTEQPYRYRNKVQFPVAQGKRGLSVGYYRPRSHDVLDASDCFLQPRAITQLRSVFKDWMEAHNISAYDEGTGRGLIRHLYVRTNSRRESLVCVVANGDSLPHHTALTDTLRRAEPALAGVVLNTNTQDTNVILGDRYVTLWGRDWLEEELCGLTFRLSVPSFFQINLPQTQRLYQAALDFAQLTGTETVLDLYCGIGTISLALAKQAGQVVGAEIVPQAIEDARENARRNGVSNVEFFCGDAGAVAQRLTQEGIRPQVICVDPPRKGLSPAVPAILASMAPNRIVYVSCDPATLARDVDRFRPLGYCAVRAQGVDLFPRTAHVETVVCLSQQKPDDVIRVGLDLDDLEVTPAESKATYGEIKAYVREKFGLKVSSLYISQVKRKCGLEVGENYNLAKSENARVPTCPPEKERAIIAALEHFQMLEGSNHK
ncbi:MAG: 23S rRNA (uracil(1939)-C(5))-methyltransferase RlmD, partial [Lawsonibacter sp.]|nr:23S rRNA (uracil(1939)-C(5))-methyltransferase RlmD [Lawsonibacter sp.]